jgi:serine protease Do
MALKRNFSFAITLIVSIVLFYGSANAVRFIPENFSELAKYAENSVVNIRTVKKASQKGFVNPGTGDPFDEFFRRFYEGMPRKDYDQKSLGSGFLIDSKGYIVTNNHVVQDADTITVKLKNGEEYEAKSIGTDPNTDLALIKIDAKKDLPHLSFGNSEKVNVGEWVVAIGSPFGLEQTVTAGIVSAKGRVIDAGPYDDFIQTDASINPGNSGGPLLNLKGEVVGINTAILANAQGIGFAIPSNMAENIIEQLKNNGEVVRGWLGVRIQNVDEGLAEYYDLDKPEGVLITDTFENNPAQVAGIKTGDVIISIDGKMIKDSRELTRVVAGLMVGTKVKVVAIRNGKRKVFDVVIGKRDGDLVSSSAQDENVIPFGIQIAELDKDTSKKLGVPYGQGVLVANLDPNGKASKEGFRKWDVILQINHKPVNSSSDYLKLIKAIKKGDKVSFFVKKYNRGFGVIKITK